MRRRALLWIALAVASGCRFDSSGVLWNGDGGTPPDAALVSVDAATTTDAGDDDLIDAVLADAAPPTCVEAACPLGCNILLDRCNRLDPTNFEVEGFYDDLSAGVSTLSTEDIRVNTDTGEIASNSTTYRPGGGLGVTLSGIYFDLVDQAGGPVLAVFAMTEIDLPDGAQLIVSGSHPAAFFATGNINLAGEVEAYSWQDTPGPGGGAGAIENGGDGAACGGGEGRGGDQAGDNGDQIEAGGGGGGLGAAGGKGADASLDGHTTAGGSGGIPISATSPLAPLRAGCGGGAGGGPDTWGEEPNHGGHGGGGGGAVQFSAQGTLAVTSSGVIDTGGGQGQGGQHGAGGGGGGSGGTILLEAAMVSVQGIVVANGGGAGAGAGGTASNGQDGAPAHQSVEPALGGLGENYGGDGGNGGAADIKRGQDGTVDANGGGGGGSVGAIGIRYHSDVDTAGTISPYGFSSVSGLAVW